MGLSNNSLKPFSDQDLHNRDLIIQMLKEEDRLFFTEAQVLYKTPSFENLTSPQVQKAIQRQVLTKFGFTNTEDDVNRYRTIVQVYWKNAQDYDQTVLNSVVYLRANKLLYYQYPAPEIDEYAIDTELFQVTNPTTNLTPTNPTTNLTPTKTKLSDHWNHHRTLVCAFSTS